MAQSDKNIVITPNNGSSTDDPKIVFSGADASTAAQNITLRVYPANGGTLSFEGSAGQLFSITNNLSGTLFSVNDVSGMPSIEVSDTGVIKLAQYSGSVLIGTGVDNGTDKLQVGGSISGTVLTSTVATGTAPLTVASTTAVSNLRSESAITASYLNTAASSSSADDITTRIESGFWQNSAPTTLKGWPSGYSSWMHLLASTHSNQSNYYSMQLAADFYSNALFYRSTSGSGTTGWNKILHDGNYSTYPLNASNLTSGTVPTARLGSGTANSNTYLRGDNTWVAPPTSPGYVHTQSTPSTTWTITHNLGTRYVNVEVINSSGVSLVGTYDYPTVTFTDVNTTTLTFSYSATGYAAVTSGGGQVGYTGSQGIQGPAGGYTGSAGATGYTGSGYSMNMATSPPVSPTVGQEWVDSNTGVKYTWVDDGTSTQWVELGGSINYGANATFNNSGSGSASGTTYNGASAVTVSYNTIGAQPLVAVSGVLKGTGSGVALATAGTDFVAPGVATTFTAQQAFAGTTSVIGQLLTNVAEVCTVSATAATGTISYYTSSQSVLYYTTGASANWTINITHSAGTTLNTALTVGQSITLAFMATQNGTAYYNNSVQVDGTTTGVTTKWQGGSAPTSGNASSIDVYTYTVIKTGSATFTVLASQTRFA